MTHVDVIAEPVTLGRSSFARAHADVFHAGELTITWADDDTEARVFRPGSWSRAIVLDDAGLVVVEFQPGQSRKAVA